MARKSLQDLSGIANTIARAGQKSKEKPARTTAPALGALQGSLASIREIDPQLIDDWGPVDRLEEFTAVNSDEDADSFSALKHSIKDGGQQVPILVRRSKREGRYEAIYGRRRLKACRELGIKVRANIQDLDDATALLAKGLENTARRNLSFYEKARFAQAIRDAGHGTDTILQVLNLSKSGLSHLTRVTDNVPVKVGDQIGAAPTTGRPKWTALADFFSSGKLSEHIALETLASYSSLSSDEKIEALLKESAKRGTRQASLQKEVTIAGGVTIKSNKTSVSLSVRKSGTHASFAVWLDENIESIIERSYAKFTEMKSQGEN